MTKNNKTTQVKTLSENEIEAVSGGFVELPFQADERLLSAFISRVENSLHVSEGAALNGLFGSDSSAPLIEGDQSPSNDQPNILTEQLDTPINTQPGPVPDNSAAPNNTSPEAFADIKALLQQGLIGFREGNLILKRG